LRNSSGNGFLQSRFLSFYNSKKSFIKNEALHNMSSKVSLANSETGIHNEK